MALVGTIFFCGALLGSVVFGTLGDKIGRKLALMVTLVLGCTASLVGALTSNYIVYTISRLLCAAG